MQNCLQTVFIKLVVATKHWTKWQFAFGSTKKENGIRNKNIQTFCNKYTFVYYSLYEKRRFQMIFLWTLEMLE